MRRICRHHWARLDPIDSVYYWTQSSRLTKSTSTAHLTQGKSRGHQGLAFLSDKQGLAQFWRH